MSDIDPQETQEWLHAMHAVLEHDGEERAHYIIEQLITNARLAGVNLPFRNTTSYVNTIAADEEERLPGDPRMEHRVRSLERWNALAMVVRANKKFPELGRTYFNLCFLCYFDEHRLQSLFSSSNRRFSW